MIDYDVTVTESLVQKVQGYILLLIMFTFSKKGLQSTKRHEVFSSFYHEFVHFVRCHSIKCKKRNRKYFVSRAKLLQVILSQTWDLLLREIMQTILMNCYNLDQHSLWILDVSGAGDCFFWVVSHKLYGEPGYHMNFRSTGIQFMSNNPERFIESSTNHLWSRYLAYVGWSTFYTYSCRYIKLDNPRYRI